MLKNRYYRLSLNDDKGKNYLLRVKKDFYTEGVSVDEDKLLQGYFYFKDYMSLSILDNNDLEAKIWEHKGIVGSIEEGVAYGGLDEEFISYKCSSKIDVNLEEITDKELIGKIDFLIRSSIRNLSPNNRQIYDFFNQRRKQYFQEFKSDITSPIYNVDGTEYIEIDDPKLDFTREDLKEIGQYLQSLNQKQIVNGRDENGKKIRKRAIKNKNKPKMLIKNK